MGIETIKFSPHVLSSFKAMSDFLNIDAEMQEISRGGAVSETLAHLRSYSSLLQPDLEAMSKVIYCHFLVVISGLLQGVGATDLSKRCYVHSRHLLDQSQLLSTFRKYRDNFLIPLTNAHRLDTEDFYLHPPLAHPLQRDTSLNFYHSMGICRGICDWFLYLYFKTQANFTSPEEHIKAVGKIFEKGAPRQAAFFQTFTASYALTLLGFGVQPDVLRFADIAGQIGTTANRIYHLPPGAYALYLSHKHRMNFIIEPSGERFFIEPNQGCLKVPDALQLQAMLGDALSKYFYSSPHELIVDRIVPRW